MIFDQPSGPTSMSGNIHQSVGVCWCGMDHERAQERETATRVTEAVTAERERITGEIAALVTWTRLSGRPLIDKAAVLRIIRNTEAER